MKHWFNEKVIFWTFAGLFVSVFVILAVLLILSPKQDVENRGFISCTNQFIKSVETCLNKESKYRTAVCGLESVTKNTICDFKIIGEGVSKWSKGEQSTPWANYLYKAKLPISQNEYFDNSSDEIDPEFEKLVLNHKKLQDQIDNLKKESPEKSSELEKFDINKFKELKK